MTKSKRVVIIGAGATGALCALHAAELGFEVVVLEKAAMGNGSSSRSAACIRAQFGVAETVMGMIYSEHFYKNFHDFVKTPAEDDRSPIMIQNGYLFLFENPDSAEDSDTAKEAWRKATEEVSMQQSLGLPVEKLDPEEVGRRWPHIRPQQDKLLIGATWCSDDGFLIHDRIYQLGFESARRLGVRLVQYHEVTGGETKAGRLRTLHTTTGSYEADVFVNATNAWAPRVSRSLGGMALRIDPLKRYLWTFKRNEDAPLYLKNLWRQLPMTIYGMGGRRGVYSRPHLSDKELIIGHAHDAEPEPEFTDEDQNRKEAKFEHDWTGDDSAAIHALLQIADFTPDLANSGGYRGTSCGYYGTTPDNNPLIGVDANLVNLVHAAGFSGHGLMHAPVTALLVGAILESEGLAAEVRLPAPFSDRRISLTNFDPKRDFAKSKPEGRVI